MTNPRVVDNDSGEITVSLNSQELRGWSYQNDAERRAKMLAAREYVEGWCDSRDRHLTALRRIVSLEEKNVPKYAQQIAREAVNGPVGGSRDA